METEVASLPYKAGFEKFPENVDEWQKKKAERKQNKAENPKNSNDNTEDKVSIKSCNLFDKSTPWKNCTELNQRY